MATETSALHAARHEFTGALQSALTLDEVSAAFMSTAPRVLPTDCTGMYRLGDDCQSVVDVRSNAWGQALDSYEQYGRDDDPVLDFVLRERRPMDSSRAAPRAVWEACGARMALRGIGLEHSMVAPLVAAGMVIGTVNFGRMANAPRFSSSDVASARLIGDQLSLAVERALRFERTGTQNTVMEGAIDRIPLAVIVADLDGRILLQNSIAREARMVSGEELTSRGGQESVAACILEAIEEFRHRGGRSHVRSIKDAATQTQHIVKSQRLARGHGAVVTVVFTHDARTTDRTLPVWKALTGREQEIVQLVSEGLTNSEIAGQAYISENTVKQHLKRIFAKTDVRNRAELIQLMWSAGRRETTDGPIHPSG